MSNNRSSFITRYFALIYVALLLIGLAVEGGILYLLGASPITALLACGATVVGMIASRLIYRRR